MNHKKRKEDIRGSRSKRPRRLAAAVLALILAFGPLPPFFSGQAFAQEVRFRILLMDQKYMQTDVDFPFFGERMGSGIYYWMKDDGRPLLCIQKHARLTDRITMEERPEGIEHNRYMSPAQYEMVSIVLQCCGMKKGVDGLLEPGAYLAAQAAVWGMLFPNWTGTDQLREEMEVLYGHVSDWHGLTAEEIIEEAREMIDLICQALADYYGDSSPYIPEFASKYPDKAPVWQAEWQDDGTCAVTFSLGTRSEDTKDFAYQLPDGWDCRWEGDQITFWCREPEEGVISVTGTAPEDVTLGDAMPIGLMHIVESVDAPSLQHLASYVEINVPWSCYFKLSVPEKPEEGGSWYLPKVQYYRHEEDFTALYGAGLEKVDGDTGKALEGAFFQPLEYFDSRQLEKTVLDPGQFTVWEGWKARCGEAATDENGRLCHWDKKTYHYEKTYCAGHPEPEILYEGNSAAVRESLEKEAWEAWESQAEACSQLCDYHDTEGMGAELLRADRDLAYEQFIHLIYGISFAETRPPEGYSLPGRNPEEEKGKNVFLESAQAGGRYREEEGREKDQPAMKSKNPVLRVRANASKSSASSSNGERKAGRNRQASPADGLKKSRKKLWRTAPVWLTSLIEPLEQETEGQTESYQFTVKNYKLPPEETEPEETTAQEETTTPEETTPPKETEPEETTTLEETMPEETTPEETTAREETSPKETTPPKETTASQETPPEETLPEVTQPEETPPEETTASRETPPPKQGGRDGREPSKPAQTEPEPEPEPLEEPVPRSGWIRVEYIPPSVIDEDQVPRGGKERKRDQQGLPKTGQQGPGNGFWFLCAGTFGLASYGLWVRRKKKKNLQALLFLLFFLPAMLSAGINSSAAENSERTPEGALIRLFPAEETPMPPSSYVDEEGREYQLDSCRLTEQTLLEKRETVREFCTYEGLESRDQVPARIQALPRKEDNRTGTGQLMIQAATEIGQYWTEGFQVPIIFGDYGAQQYDFQGAAVPQGNELPYLLENQQLILDEIGCDPGRYQIDQIIWTGEPYAEQGVLCRNALAKGRKMLSDYLVEYAGQITYPKTAREQWEAVYLPAAEPVYSRGELPAQAEGQEALLPEPVDAGQPIFREEPFRELWRRIRTAAVFTVSVTAFIPIFLYLLVRRRKRDRTPQI